VSPVPARQLPESQVLAAKSLRSLHSQLAAMDVAQVTQVKRPVQAAGDQQPTLT
jgi:hypothetical protein